MPDMKEIEKVIDSKFDEVIQKLGEWVAIPSVLDETDKDTPFGKDIQKQLEVAIDLCNDWGWQTHIDPNGYYGWAEIGSGEKLMGLLIHLDVVPAGDLDEWNTDPFKMEEIGAYLHGRGTADDKGPGLMAMYAVKAMLDAGHDFGCRVRLIFGTDEEVLWRGIDQYKADGQELPSFGFVPDSSFPVVFAEKSLIEIEFKTKNDTGVEFLATGAMNVVPGKHQYAGQKPEEFKAALESLGFEYKVNDAGYIDVIGKSMHSKDSPKGVNAVIRTIKAKQKIGETNQGLDFIANVFDEDARGFNLWGDVRDEFTGELTVNIPRVHATKDEVITRIDVRSPATGIDKDEICALIKKHGEKYGIYSVEVVDYLRPVFADKEGTLIKTLMGSYQKYTGDMTSEPIASGGATFAKAIDNAVAFGALFPGEPKTEHQPNEKYRKEHILLGMKIYADALFHLAK